MEGLVTDADLEEWAAHEPGRVYDDGAFIDVGEEIAVEPFELPEPIRDWMIAWACIKTINARPGWDAGYDPIDGEWLVVVERGDDRLLYKSRRNVVHAYNKARRGEA